MTTQSTDSANTKKPSDNSLAKALATFRSKIETVKKTEDNPFFKSKYADLSSILEAIKAPLAEAGLSLHHQSVLQGEQYVVITTLTEITTGESIVSMFPIFGAKPQEIGSSITYARRYNIQALLDIPTNDDDANSANNAKPVVSKTAGKQSITVWFDPKNEKHIESVKHNRDAGLSGYDIVTKIKESGMGVSKANADLIINNEI